MITTSTNNTVLKYFESELHFVHTETRNSKLFEYYLNQVLPISIM